MNFATLMVLVQKGRVTARSVLRGPTTGQFWKHAAKVKGVAREFGLCWNCGGDISRNGRACPACKRMQEPPLNPDVLLEPGEMSADDLTEQMWAADAPSSQMGSAPVRSAHSTPVERLMNKGGLRREVAPQSRAEADAGDHFGSEPEPPRPCPTARPNPVPAARNGNGHAHPAQTHHESAEGAAFVPHTKRSAPSSDGDDLVASLSSSLPADDGLDELSPRRRPRNGQTHGTGIPPRPQAMPRGILSGGSEDLAAPSSIEMSVFQMPYDGRRGERGGVLSKLLKVLLIAVFLAGAGLGAMCYFDESIRGKTLGYWDQLRNWVVSLTKNSTPVGNPAVTPGGAEDESGDKNLASPAGTRALAAPGALGSPDGVRSRLTAPAKGTAAESPIRQAVKLFGNASDLEARGEFAQAVLIYNQIADLKLRSEQLPIGVEARAAAARRKAAEQAK